MHTDSRCQLDNPVRDVRLARGFGQFAMARQLRITLAEVAQCEREARLPRCSEAQQRLSALGEQCDLHVVPPLT